jgi:hypothetical protein
MQAAMVAQMNFKVVAWVIVVAFLASIPAAADEPPFSVDQVKELHSLLNGKDGDDWRVPSWISMGLGLKVSGSIRHFSATGNRLGYEFGALPNNSGYLMAYIAPGGGPIFRLDPNFRLVSAIHTNSTSDPPSALSISGATPLYNEDILVWREILDHAKN